MSPKDTAHQHWGVSLPWNKEAIRGWWFTQQEKMHMEDDRTQGWKGGSRDHGRPSMPFYKAVIQEAMGKAWRILKRKWSELHFGSMWKVGKGPTHHRRVKPWLLDPICAKHKWRAKEGNVGALMPAITEATVKKEDWIHPDPYDTSKTPELLWLIRSSPLI